MKTTSTERNLVRDLAEQVAEVARRPAMTAIQKRWRDVNALRRPDRAPVWCRPMGVWDEILPETSLHCTEPWLREIERQFRQLLHKVDIGDDTPFQAFFDVPAVFAVTPATTWGVEIQHHSTGDKGGAWGFNPPLQIETDFNRLIMPHWVLDRAATQQAMERAHDLLGDILPVRLQCGPGFDSATIGSAAAELRGMEQMMVDMMDQPALMHRLMAYLRDARLRLLDTWEATGLLTHNNDSPMLCSDPIGELKNQRLTLANCWCAGNSQEFDMVSPDMWEEFCLNYQKPIFARFGLACYGCCENLGRKITGVLSIPNLRIFVCSAWTTLDVALQHVPPQYCIMWRQKASDVILPHQDETIRQHLIDGARKLQGRPYQIVLRELQTLAGHPDRLHRWTQLAIEAAEKFS